MTNKHVFITVIVAPLLSLLAWYCVGALLGEKPRLAQPGESYPLLEKSTCRYASGQCELENADLELTLKYNESVVPRRLELRSSHPLDGVVVSVVSSAAATAPAAMQVLDERALSWYFPLGQRPDADARLRLVVGVGGASYFADAATAFMQVVPARNHGGNGR